MDGLDTAEESLGALKREEYLGRNSVKQQTVRERTQKGCEATVPGGEGRQCLGTLGVQHVFICTDFHEFKTTDKYT